jgi:large subunit ribosomal protein L30
MAKLRISWRKSAIGYGGDQKRTIQALGLRRLGHTVEHEDTRSIRGMITKVRHLVTVAEIPKD